MSPAAFSGLDSDFHPRPLLLPIQRPVQVHPDPLAAGRQYDSAVTVENHYAVQPYLNVCIGRRGVHLSTRSLSFRQQEVSLSAPPAPNKGAFQGK